MEANAFWSEKVKKFFKNEDDCIAAEKAFDEEEAVKAELKRKEEEKQANKEACLEEIKYVLGEIESDKKKLAALLNDFNENYGPYVGTTKTADGRTIKTVFGTISL